MIACPLCGSSARVNLVGLPAGCHPAAYRCYGCPKSSWREHNFSGEGKESDEVCNEARAGSRARAQEMRR